MSSNIPADSDCIFWAQGGCERVYISPPPQPPLSNITFLVSAKLVIFRLYRFCMESLFVIAAFIGTTEVSAIKSFSEKFLALLHLLLQCSSPAHSPTAQPVTRAIVLPFPLNELPFLKPTHSVLHQYTHTDSNPH